MQSPLAAFVAASFALLSTASAEDARITCTGTVGSLHGGVGTQPFANAAVGEAVTVIMDLELTRQLPLGEYLYALNSPTCSVSIGAVTTGIEYVPFDSVALRNDFGQHGDVVSFAAQIAGSPSTTLQLFLVDVTGAAVSFQDVRDLYGTSLPLGSFDGFFRLYSPTGSLDIALTSVDFGPAPGSLIGSQYCTAVPNSTGSIATTTAYGLQTPGDNDLTLKAAGLPPQSFGYFLVSSSQGFVAGAGGSAGNLCLGGDIGRFVGPGQVTQADFGGEIALPVDLAALPTPLGPMVVQAGQTWNFQLWFRDAGTMGQTSNFTRGLSVTFQ